MSVNCLHVRVEKHGCNLVRYRDKDITCLDCFTWLFCPETNKVEYEEDETERQKQMSRM